MARYVLAGDVGGTKTDLALYALPKSRAAAKPARRHRAENAGAAPGLELVREATVPSKGRGGLEEILESFLATGKEKPVAAAFGIPGPVIDEVVVTTNLPWRIDAKGVGKAIGTRHVRLMNDLETTAFGALFLAPDELEALQPGKSRRGNRAVIAAGTGLGQAFLHWNGRTHVPSATEGGHADFAPRDDREMELLRFLRQKFGRVSWERVVSGMGLANLWEFATTHEKRSPGDAVRKRLAAGDDVGAVIGEAAVAGSDPLCAEVVDWFVRLYGAQAGNLALTVMATGGVYVGGGIVGKLLPRVRGGGFLAAFRAKGRYEAFMEEIPVRVILNPRCSRLGAAEAARALL